MRLVYITLARKILCYGSFPAKVLLGTNAYNSQIKKKKLSQLQAYLQLLQNQYAHKRRKSWQRIKDIALTCGIEKLFEYGFSALQKPDSYNQIIVCQGINETKNNYIIQQNNSKEQNLLIFGLPILFILIAAYYLLH